MKHKIPVSVLVVLHTADLKVLLLERADRPGYWQSVTGSQDREGEPAAETARREVQEETGFDTAAFELTDWGIENRYEIYPMWRHRYAPGITHNTEHVFGLLLPQPQSPQLEPREHLRYEWLDYRDAATRCFSPSNRDAIMMLPGRTRA